MDTLLTSGVIASLLTSLFSLYNLKQTNTRLFELERLKNANTIQSFRYSKLHELNTELSALPAIDYNYLESKDGKQVENIELIKKVLLETTERFSTIKQFYSKVKPFLDEKYIERIDNLINDEQHESSKLVAVVYGGANVDIDVPSLLAIRLEIEKQFKHSITEQIKELFN